MSKAKIVQLLSLMNWAATESRPSSNHYLTVKNTMSDDEKNEKNGLKKFYFGSNFVWASGKNAANKKAKKLGYI